MTAVQLRVSIIAEGGPGGAGRALGDWLACRAGRHPDLEVDLIDLASACLPDAPAEAAPGAPPLVPPAVRDLGPWLAAADAFVVVTGELHHSIPGSLKNAIDWYGDEWKAKPVALASHGADTGGRYAVQQLRLVFAAAHAVTVRDSVSCCSEDRDPDAADRVLGQLIWWARALRTARTDSPYAY